MTDDPSPLVVSGREAMAVRHAKTCTRGCWYGDEGIRHVVHPGPDCAEGQRLVAAASTPTVRHVAARACDAATLSADTQIDLVEAAVTAARKAIERARVAAQDYRRCLGSGDLASDLADHRDQVVQDLEQRLRRATEGS